MDGRLAGRSGPCADCDVCKQATPSAATRHALSHSGGTRPIRLVQARFPIAAPGPAPTNESCNCWYIPVAIHQPATRQAGYLNSFHRAQSYSCLARSASPSERPGHRVSVSWENLPLILPDGHNTTPPRSSCRRYQADGAELLFTVHLPPRVIVRDDAGLAALPVGDRELKTRCTLVTLSLRSPAAETPMTSSK